MPDQSQSNELLPETPGWSYGDILPLARGPAGQLSLAVPGFLRGAVNDLGLALTVPGKVASGEMSLHQAAPLVPQMALGMTGLGLGGEAPEGALRIFAGRTAKTADTVKLAEAMSMDSKGFDERHIWNRTGWMKGPDGQWRFEIPDQGARLQPSAVYSGHEVNFGLPKAAVSPSGDTLGDLLNHPELFKAYPEYKNLPVRQPSSPGYAGAYLPSIHTMELSTMSPEDFLSTALHETQHAVQSKEGFGAGGSPEDFLSPQFHNTHAVTKMRLESAMGLARDVGADPDIVKRAATKQIVGIPLSQQEEDHVAKVPAAVLNMFHDTLNTLSRLGDQREAATASYRNLAGEVEARNVQERHASGETAYPPATPGYTPFEQQIVRFDPATGLMASFKGYHGTPYTFEPVEHNPFGEFQPQAIGSGEGAQAYGWGHYVAGNKAVAEGYRDKLSRGLYPSTDTLQQYFKPGDVVNGYGGRDRVVSFNPGEQGKWSVTVQAVDKNGNPLPGIDGRLRTHTTVPRPEEIEKKLGPQQLGNLYHVEIKPDEHELLDWEKPLTEQDPKVQTALEKAGFDIKTMNKIKLNPNRNYAVGSDVYRLLQHEYGAGDDSARLASEALHNAGIPGIKYLDEGSRYKQPFTLRSYFPGEEEPDLTSHFNSRTEAEAVARKHSDMRHEIQENPISRNYVIFHPSNLKIVGRNGVEWQPEPLEHNPFTHQAKSVDYNPFAPKGTK